jgi:hypothetical protein
MYKVMACPANTIKDLLGFDVPVLSPTCPLREFRT